MGVFALKPTNFTRVLRRYIYRRKRSPTQKIARVVRSESGMKSAKLIPDFVVEDRVDGGVQIAVNQFAKQGERVLEGVVRTSIRM
jgi:hypothetical protein